MLLFSLKSFAQSQNSYISSELCNKNEIKKELRQKIPGSNGLIEKHIIGCMRVFPKDPEVYLLYSKLVSHEVNVGEKPTSKLKSALTLLGQAYSLDSKNPTILYTLAQTLRDYGENEESEQIFGNFMKEFPDHRLTLLEVAFQKLEKNSEESFLWFEQKNVASMLEADELSAYLIAYVKKLPLDKIYYQKIENLTQKYQTSLFYDFVGKEFLKHADYIRSAYYFKKVLEIEDNIDVRLQLAVIQYKELGNTKAALTNFNDILNKLRGNSSFSSAVLSLVYAHQSVALASIHQNLASSKAALEVEKRSFQDKTYWEAMIYELLALNKLFVADLAIKQMIKDCPSYSLGFVVAGEMQSILKNYTTAINYYSDAINLDPKEDKYYSLRANAYVAQKKFDFALEDYSYASHVNPDEASHDFNKSSLLAKMGNYQESLNSLKKAIHKDKNYSEIADATKEFDVLKNNHKYASKYFEIVQAQENHS